MDCIWLALDSAMFWWHPATIQKLYLPYLIFFTAYLKNYPVLIGTARNSVNDPDTDVTVYSAVEQ